MRILEKLALLGYHTYVYGTQYNKTLRIFLHGNLVLELTNCGEEWESIYGTAITEGNLQYWLQK